MLRGKVVMRYRKLDESHGDGRYVPARLDEFSVFDEVGQAASTDSGD